MMEWINRAITDHLKMKVQNFPAVLITGPRQVGKSSLLQTLNHDFEYISLDNPILPDQVKTDPELFFLNHSDIVILDEIQYVPDLLPYLKIKIDEMRFAALQGTDKEKCLFLSIRV